MPRHTMAPPSPGQERRAASFYGDLPRARRNYRKCCDCPAEFPCSGRKERCGPCSDLKARQRNNSKRQKARLALVTEGAP